MKYVSGSYWLLPLYGYICEEPDIFSLVLSDATIEIRNRQRVFDFCVVSDTADKNEFRDITYKENEYEKSSC
jgi:hypothetical protein